MRKLILFTFLIGLLISCDNGKLTNSKAEDIIRETLKDNPKVIRLDFHKIGKHSFDFKDEDPINKKFNEIKEMQNLGLIKIELIDSNYSKWYKHWTKKYNVSFTDKAHHFVLDTVERKINRWLGGKTYVMKLSDLELDKVQSVHEIPSMNKAEVMADFKKVNKAFFYDLLSDDKKDVQTEKLTFLKTNDGWILKD